MVKFNWNDVDESAFMVPVGRYPVRVIAVAQKQSQSGFEMWALTLEITGGAQDKKQVYEHVVFSPKAMWRAKKILRALGIPLELEREIRPSEAEGKKAIVSIIHESYTDKDGNPRRTSKPDEWFHIDTPAPGPKQSATTAQQQPAEAPPDEVPF